LIDIPLPRRSHLIEVSKYEIPLADVSISDDSQLMNKNQQNDQNQNSSPIKPKNILDLELLKQKEMNDEPTPRKSDVKINSPES
jgi:hypothetical protein